MYKRINRDLKMEDIDTEDEVIDELYLMWEDVDNMLPSDGQGEVIELTVNASDAHTADGYLFCIYFKRDGRLTQVYYSEDDKQLSDDEIEDVADKFEDMDTAFNLVAFDVGTFFGLDSTAPDEWFERQNQ